MSNYQARVRNSMKRESKQDRAAKRIPKASAVLRWYTKGLSLREIGQKLKCSHQAVKRILDAELSLPTFHWRGGNLLSPYEVKKRLQDMLREHCGDIWLKVSARIEEEWIGSCMGAIFGPEGVRDELQELLEYGPSRPGRRRSYEDVPSKSAEARRNAKEIPLSALRLRRADGTFMSDGDSFDKIWSDQQKLSTGHVRSKRPPEPLAPTGNSFEPCPICSRPTAYTMPPCTVIKNGEVYTETRLWFNSKLCQTGQCAKMSIKPTEQESKPQGFVRGFEGRRARVVTPPSCAPG